MELVTALPLRLTTTDNTATFTPQTSKGGQQAIAQTNIVVSGNKGQVLDNAIVRFDGGQQLGKFSFREGSTKVYIPQDGKNYAVVNAERAGEMPVSFKAEENGSYSLSFTSQEVNFSYLHLIDNMTGNDVDLLQTPSYSFYARTTDYANRFKLVFSAKDASTDSASDETFAFISNGNIIITDANANATLQIVDMTGRVIVCRDAKSCVSTSEMTPGMYVLRLINGDDVKTQKIVIP